MHRISIILIILFIFGGCSKAQFPTSPAANPGDSLPSISELPDGSYFRGDMSLGVWEVIVDLDTLEYDTSMVRGASAIGTAIPDAFLTPYLLSAPCTTCMRMDILRFDPVLQRITLSIGVRHPIPTYNPAAPVSALNRADLDVFDVMGIVLMPDNNANFTYLIDGTTPVQADVWTLINPDAYTHSMYDIITNNAFVNPAYAEPYSTLNPIKYYSWGAQDKRWTTGTGFEMLDYVFDTRYVFGNQLRFYIAFRASYGQSATFAKTIQDEWQVGSRRNPKYFLPEFNMVEPYDITVAQTGDDITWKDFASTTQFTVSCKDHQAGKTGAGRYLLETDPQDIISFTSDVENAALDIPAMGDLPWVQTSKTGMGIEGDPYVFTFDVQNNKGASFGTYKYLVAVEDNRGYPPSYDAYQVGCIRIPYEDDFTRFNPITETGYTVQTFSGAGWGFYATDGIFDESGGGNYTDEEVTRLSTPVFDFSCSSAHPYMEITHTYQAQLFYDGCGVLMSLDGGSTFEPGSLTIIGGKDYDAILIGNLVQNTILGGRWCFTGDSLGLVSTQFDLTDAAYHSDVVIVFVFESDYFTNFKGWTIEEVNVYP
jgi:hypothetical protein